MRRLLIAFLLCALVCFAASERKRITYNNFSGGLYSAPDVTKCQSNQLLEAFNIILNREGTIQSQWGLGFNPMFYQYTAAIASPSFIVDLFSVPNSYGFVTFDAWKGTVSGIGYLQSSVTVYDYLASQSVYNLGQFAYLEGEICRSSTATCVIRIASFSSSSPAASATMDTSSPVSRVLLTHNGRLFAANKSNLYETAVASPSGWAGGEVWNIGGGTRGDIQALGSIDGELYVFFDNAIYRMTGYSPSERNVTEYISGVGTRFPDTVKPVHLSAHGPGIVFLSSDKRLYFMNSSSVQNIGEAIQTRLNALSPTYNPLTWGNVFTVWDSRYRYLYLFDMERTSGTSVYSPAVDDEIIMFGDLPYPSQYGTRYAFSGIGVSPSLASRSLNISAACANQGLSPYLEPGEMTAVGMASSASVIASPSFGYFSASTLWATNKTSARIRTKEEDAGDTRILKGWKKVTLTDNSVFPILSGGNASMTQFQYLKTNPKFLGDYSSAPVPLYNWSDYLSLRIDFGQPAKLDSIDIDYVTGPKVE